MIGDAAAIHVVFRDGEVGRMVEKAVEDMSGFPGRGGNDLGMERRVAIGDVGIEGDGGLRSLVRVDRAGRLRPPVEREVLAVRA
jgi:hypothetical protein